MLNTLRNSVPRAIHSLPGMYDVWNTSMGPGGHLKGMDILVVWHSADWAFTEQHTGNWGENRKIEGGATASFHGLFRVIWLFLM